MKIAFLFKKDSHFKAVKSTALRLCAQYNCEPIFIGVDSEYFPIKERHSVIYIGIQDLTSLFEYDYVIACLGGYLLNHVVSALRHTNTKVISIFPGIVSHYQFDAFISRLNADQVWLNSRADYDLYNKICSIFGKYSNGILYGMSWLDLKACNIEDNTVIESDRAIFFEQTEILSKNSDRKRFLSVLEKIIVMNPNIYIKYKVRNNTNDEYFSKVRSYLSHFENVNVVESLTPLDIAQARYYLSISSSALIEGIVCGKSSYIIDSYLLDSDSKEFYKKSNLNLQEVNLTSNLMCINKEWYEQRIFLPLEKVNLSSIIKNDKPIFFHNRNLNFIRLKLLRLIFIHPKIFYLIISKIRLCHIQKSLEYTSIQ